MAFIVEISFYFILFLMLNAYFFYPVGLNLFFKFGRIKSKTPYSPNVSILIAAYNEENVIRKRIENIASQNYDFSKVELVIGSDCSSDDSNNILLEAEKELPWLKVKIFNERRGKAGVLNDLINAASNDILVFTDANTVFENDSIKNLVCHFSDEKIGGVCGKLILSDENIEIGEGVEEVKYWQFETIIKRGEGKLGILIGANGGNFAIRKSLATYLPPDKPVTDDLFLSLAVLLQGYKFIYENESLATEDVGKSIDIELKRKVRFAATNFQTLALTKGLLLNKNILLSYAYWSHKVLRWFFPLLMIFLFITSILLSQLSAIYKTVLYIQIIFYLLSFIGYLLTKLKIKISLFSLPYFFFASNIALLKGLLRYLQGKHTVIWQSTKR